MNNTIYNGMNKYIVGAIVVAGALMLLTYNFSNNEESVTEIKNVDSKITVSELTYDFGEIEIFGGKVSTEYVLENEGTQDVSILSAVTSCMCTEGEIGDLVFGMHESSGKTVVIPAGEEKILTATFDPLAHGPNGTGKIKRELMLKTNSTVTPDIKVTFSGNVVKSETE